MARTLKGASRKGVVRDVTRGVGLGLTDIARSPGIAAQHSHASGLLNECRDSGVSIAHERLSTAS